MLLLSDTSECLGQHGSEAAGTQVTHSKLAAGPWHTLSHPFSCEDFLMLAEAQLSASRSMRRRQLLPGFFICSALPSACSTISIHQCDIGMKVSACSKVLVAEKLAF